VKSRFITIMVVPESSKTVHWTVSSLGVKVILGLLVVLGLGGAAVLYDYIQLTGQVAENKALRLENRQLAIQLQSLDNKLGLVQTRLENIHQFEEKIRKFTSLNDPERMRTLAMGPVEDQDAKADGEDGTFGALERDVSSEDPLRTLRTASMVSNMDMKLREVARVSRLKEQSVHDLYEIVQENQSFLRSMPSIRPALGWVTSTFGYRVSPYTGYKKLHDGLDIAAGIGTMVFAPADGVVTFAGVKPGYGLVLVIDHGYGIETRYAHNSKFLVKPGDVVKRGQKVANTGNTGLSTGPHLHYEVRINGIPIDPAKYFLE
jgi:murein DD-endopeptidase MepM/ murein hydrolase activator NlpD